jgi:hypothetical protein
MSRMCMATISRSFLVLTLCTISRPLSIFPLSLGCVWLQSLDHYQSLFGFKDWYGYNMQTTTNLYSVSRTSMATISRPLSICTMCTISRSLPIFIMCLGWVWLQSSDHYQSVFCVEDEYCYNFQTIIILHSVSRMYMATISRPLPIFILCRGWRWLQSPDNYQSSFCV